MANIKLIIKQLDKSNNRRRNRISVDMSLETKPNSEIILYQTEDGKTKIEVRLENDTVWLTQAHISKLFQKAKSTVSEHLKNIFKEDELDENSVVRNFRTVQIERNRSVTMDIIS